MFRPVQNASISEKIARQIKSAILSGRLKPGDKLPSERELVARFRVSRVSVREALHSLDTGGLVVVRKGTRGGHFVADPSSRPVTESLKNQLRLGLETLEYLTEARVLLEPEIARLAARRATAADLAALEALVNEGEALVSARRLPRRYDMGFHRLMAQATHNPVLALTINSMMDILAERVKELGLDLEVNRKITGFHRRVLEALKARDSEAACRLMREHVGDTERRLRRLSRATAGSTAGRGSG